MELAIRYDPDVIIIDTLQKLRGLFLLSEEKKDLSYSEDVRFMSNLSKYASNCSLFIVHHDRKGTSGNNNDRIQMASGTNGITGSVDEIWSLSRERFSEMTKLSFTGRRIADKQMFLNFDFETGYTFREPEEKEVEEEKVGMSDKMKTVLSLCEQGYTDFADMASQSGINFNTIKMYVRRLKQRGLLS